MFASHSGTPVEGKTQSLYLGEKGDANSAAHESKKMLNPSTSEVR